MSALTIGADGIFSAVRGKMQRSARFNFDQLYISHGYSELTIPPAADGSFQMEAEALPSGRGMTLCSSRYRTWTAALR